MRDRHPFLFTDTSAPQCGFAFGLLLLIEYYDQT